MIKKKLRHFFPHEMNFTYADKDEYFTTIVEVSLPVVDNHTSLCNLYLRLSVGTSYWT